MRAFNKGNIKRDCALKIFISRNKVGLDLHVSGEALRLFYPIVDVLIVN